MTPCIEWQGALNSGGYPITWKEGKTTYAHRAVVKAPSGQVVMHLCDNKKCVNPDHLKIGSHKENSQDMVNKGRQAKGEACARAKLTDDLVKEIFAYKGKLSSRKVASLYNISKTNVLDIWNLKIWRHLEQN